MSIGMAFAVSLFLSPAQEREAPQIDEKAKTVSFGAKAAQTDKYEQLKGAIEYVVVLPKGKEYESCFVANVDPIKLHEALQKIGAKPGKPAQSEKEPATGSTLKIRVEWKDGEKERREPIEKFVMDEETKKPLENVAWVYSGSKEGFIPELEGPGLLVLSMKNLIGLYQGDGTTLVTHPAGLMTGHRFKVNKALLPKEGTAVRIVIEAAKVTR